MEYTTVKTLRDSSFGFSLYLRGRIPSFLDIVYNYILKLAFLQQ